VQSKRASVRCILVSAFALSVDSCTFAEAPTHPMMATRLHLIESDDPCTDEAVGAIALALLPAVLNQGLSYIQDLLKSAAEKYSAQYTASQSTIFYTHCQGKLIPRIKGFMFGYGPVGGAPKTPDLNPKYSQLGFIDEPDVYLEVDLTYGSEDAGKGLTAAYFRMIPRTLEFKQPVAAHGTEKDVLFTVSFTFPTAYNGEGKPPGASTAAVLPLYENVVAPYSTAGGETSASGWALIPGTPPGRTLAGGQKVSPVNIVVTANETDKGKGAAILLKVGQAIADSGKSLETALTNKSEGANSK